MVIAVDPREEFEYVLASERSKPKEEQTVFLLRPLTYRQRAQLKNLAVGFDAATAMGHPRSGDVEMNSLRAGLVGWRNFQDRDGSDVQFEREGKRLNVLGEDCDPPTWKTLDRLPAFASHELAEAISEGAELAEEELPS